MRETGHDAGGPRKKTGHVRVQSAILFTRVQDTSFTKKDSETLKTREEIHMHDKK